MDQHDHSHGAGMHHHTSGTSGHGHGCDCPGCVDVNAGTAALVEGAAGDLAPLLKIISDPPVTNITIDPPSPDSIPASTATSASVAVGGSVNGVLETLGDRDWFEVTLESGKVYEIDLFGSGASPVSDTFLRFYDGAGGLLATNDDGGPGLNSMLSYAPSSNGTFYIEAASFNDSRTGDYTISVAEIAVGGALPVDAVQGTAAPLGEDRSAIGYYFTDTSELSLYGALLASGSQPGWTAEEGWSTNEASIVRSALDYIESLIDVTFVEVATQAEADLDFLKNDDSGSLGIAGTFTDSVGGNVFRNGTVLMNQTVANRWALGKDEGGQGYETLVHEIGHALGLGHTHDTGFGSQTLLGMDGYSAFSGGALGFNDPINSIMAYRDGWAAEATSQTSYGNRGNFGAWDQQALINIYGAATPTAAGADVYLLPDMSGAGTFFETIYDTNGTDTISANGATLDAVIDLRAATLDDNVETSGGPVSHHTSGGGVIAGGFTIAAATVIENAVGGSGNDMITGNSSANDLNGQAGQDVILAGSGADVVHGEDGNDSLFGNSGDDSLFGGDDDDRLSGSSGDDSLRGNEGDDTLFGGANDDTLRGDDGENEMYGGTGNDKIYGGGDSDEMSGASGDDRLVGGGGDDSVGGGSDDDVLFGNAGNDTLDGETGNDWSSGGGGLDLMFGRSGNDTMRGGNEDDRLFGGTEIDILAGNNGDDTLEGGSDNDRLFGGGGEDEINGGAGTDFLNGGRDADVFMFEAVSDSIHGSARDTIADFVQGTDMIDLSGIMSGMTFVNAYTGSAGEIRYNDSIGRLYLDVDGDSASDFSINLTGTPALGVGDLIL